MELLMRERKAAHALPEGRMGKFIGTYPICTRKWVS